MRGLDLQCAVFILGRVIWWRYSHQTSQENGDICNFALCKYREILGGVLSLFLIKEADELEIFCKTDHLRCARLVTSQDFENESNGN